MSFVAGSNISHYAVGRFSPERMARIARVAAPVPTDGQEKGNVGDCGHDHRAGETWVGASIRSARTSAMAATVLGHGSGVESFVGGLLSARLTEALSGGRSSCNVFQSVSRSTRSY